MKTCTGTSENPRLVLGHSKFKTEWSLEYIPKFRGQFLKLLFGMPILGGITSNRRFPECSISRWNQNKRQFSKG